jgi:hypothetical protein
MVVLARKEQRRALAGEVILEGGRFALELGRQFGIRRLLDELQRCQEVVRAALQTSPQLDLGAEPAGLAKDLLSAPLIVPEAGLGGQRLQL